MTLSRRKFLGLAGGSAATASLLAACGSSSDAESSNGGVDGLNDLLTLEYVETDFYLALVDSRLFVANSSEPFHEFVQEEEKHVVALSRAIKRLGGTPKPRPKTEFELKSKRATLELASELENVGVGAYLGQLPSIDSSVLETVLSIHSVEGRHAAAAGYLLGEPVSPDGAFAKPVSIETALAAVKPYIVA